MKQRCRIILNVFRCEEFSGGEQTSGELDLLYMKKETALVQFVFHQKYFVKNIDTGFIIFYFGPNMFRR